ncbi:hypothetical protein BK126_26450 [Paenibacillus sp. FSL H7-0326]|uniref:hypothetical protein n=1 Tax=Paenibacillus sp. FSL H7-0326 TaxID=1921144 RepID=UPI00096DD585|nr:hypothetical protein [Paenibacillus sp. FSL H7-0326]OMC63736.1 hypothetical protein BK126_26450 [Paenibacillus sp. FSL H7-0326]
MKVVRTGIIKGSEFIGAIGELDNGKWMASLAAVATAAGGFNHHYTKVCDDEDKAVKAINDTWSELEKI